jgi:hypothetical protein
MIAKAAFALSFVAIVISIAMSFVLYTKLTRVESLVDAKKTAREAATQSKTNEPSIHTSLSGEVTKKDIENLKNDLNKAIATISAQVPQPSSGVKTETGIIATPVPKQITTYLPINTSFASGSPNWIDVPNSEFVMDFYADYGEKAVGTWSAFLKIDQGNGTAFIRIYDATHNIGVQGSDMETQSQNSVQLQSGTLAFWRGKNTYKVQIRSLTGYTTFFETGRIKITY